MMRLDYRRYVFETEASDALEKLVLLFAPANLHINNVLHFECECKNI